MPEYRLFNIFGITISLLYYNKSKPSLRILFEQF